MMKDDDDHTSANEEPSYPVEDQAPDNQECLVGIRSLARPGPHDSAHKSLRVPHERISYAGDRDKLVTGLGGVEQYSNSTYGVITNGRNQDLSPLDALASVGSISREYALTPMASCKFRIFEASNLV